MYTTIILLIFIAFFFLYNTSKKSKWEDKPKWASHLEQREKQSVFISAALMLIACIILISINGTVSGIFTFILINMAMGNLIVLLFPFRYISIKQTALLFLLFVVFEQLIF